MLPFGLDWTRSCPSSQGFFWRNSPRVRPLRCGGIGVNGTHVSVLSLSLSLSRPERSTRPSLSLLFTISPRCVANGEARAGAFDVCQKRTGALFHVFDEEYGGDGGEPGGASEGTLSRGDTSPRASAKSRTERQPKEARNPLAPSRGEKRANVQKERAGGRASG